MAKLSKRMALVAGKIDREKFYPVTEAIALVKECATAKFNESIDIAVQLGIDPKKSDQLVRGSVVRLFFGRLLSKLRYHLSSGC